MDDTVHLVCIGRYRSSLGSYNKGVDLYVTPERAALLHRDSPSSFKVWEEASAESKAEVQDRVAAISEETASGLSVPDRRVRGGARRTAGKGKT